MNHSAGSSYTITRLARGSRVPNQSTAVTWAFGGRRKVVRVRDLRSEWSRSVNDDAASRRSGMEMKVPQDDRLSILCVVGLYSVHVPFDV